MWDACLNANELQTLHVSHTISGFLLHQPGRPMVVFKKTLNSSSQEAA